MNALAIIIKVIVFSITAILAISIRTLAFLAIFYLLLKIGFIRRFARRIMDRIYIDDDTSM